MAKITLAGDDSKEKSCNQLRKRNLDEYHRNEEIAVAVHKNEIN